MKLNDTKVRNAKAQAGEAGKLRPLKLFDGGGMFLLVNPDGSKWWRLKYRMFGKEKSLSLGVYDDVSLKAAREKRDEARKLIAAGIDPSAQRRATKNAHADTFRAVALEHLAIL